MSINCSLNSLNATDERRHMELRLRDVGCLFLSLFSSSSSSPSPSFRARGFGEEDYVSRACLPSMRRMWRWLAKLTCWGRHLWGCKGTSVRSIEVVSCRRSIRTSGEVQGCFEDTLARHLHAMRPSKYHNDALLTSVLLRFALGLNFPPGVTLYALLQLRWRETVLGLGRR